MTPATHNPVVIELTRGNDYLNTVIPYQDPHHYQHRPHPDALLLIAATARHRVETYRVAPR